LVQYSILIADGDPEYIQYLSGTLRANGFDARGTSSGRDALGIYKAEAPDLVVADMELVEMGGLSLLEELRSFDPQTKVILTTTSSTKELVTRAFRMGALDILEKPLDFEFLTNKIQELVSREDRALEGNLKMMSLASIVQINCEERNLAQLILNYQGRSGSVFFKDGEMIHAESGLKTGEEAVYELLEWEDGSFQLKMGVEPSLRTIDTPWSGVILEGMRRIDESTAPWSPEWDGGDFPEVGDQKSQVQERIAKAILSSSDVSSAVITTLDGTLIAQENSSDPEGDSALGVVLYEKANMIGSFLDCGDLNRAVLTGSANRFYMQIVDGNLVLLSLTKRSSAETVFESLTTIQKRYQSA
jgi:DNA-binding response OmpR family regulator/predicted regulator of Ras-like GTPase activity (Roadblock/LC7/MglB family)